MPSLRGRRQLLKSPKPSSKRGVTIAIRQKSNTSARRQKSDVKPKQEPDDTTFADVMQVLSSGMPMLIEPSNQRRPHKMTYHMDKRLEQIWGNYKAFAAIKHVSEDFGRITSTFFGITARQMAQTVSREQACQHKDFDTYSGLGRYGLGISLCVWRSRCVDEL